MADTNHTPTPRNALIRCRGVTKDFGKGDTKVRALRGVDLDVYPGQMTLLVGPSGCGKTTLLSVIAGILKPTSGSVDVLGHDITRVSQAKLVNFRRVNVGFVFQQFNLLPALTAAENVTVPLIIAGWHRGKALAKANELLKSLGMLDRAGNLPGQLSGGQQQRVAIARALIHEPRLLVCDEPTSALDAKTGQTTMELLKELSSREDRAVIVVTHDSRVFRFGDVVARMEDGQMVEVLDKPHDPETASDGHPSFLSSDINLVK